MNKMDIDLNTIEITVMGYTFKENCEVSRNTKVKNLLLSMRVC